MSNRDWTPAAADPRIQTRWTGGGYQARWELPIPATRKRCPACRKDIVPKKDGSLHGHKCDSQDGLVYPRGYTYVRKNAGVRLFGTLSQAVEVARERAGFAYQATQIEIKETG